MLIENFLYDRLVVSISTPLDTGLSKCGIELECLPYGK